jgi:hypothetical protein
MTISYDRANNFDFEDKDVDDISRDTSPAAVGGAQAKKGGSRNIGIPIVR